MTITLEQTRELARQLRVDSIRATTAAGSGHPTSSLSAADLMAVLMARHLRFDFDQPHHPNRDHLIFSKGHASPLLYAMYRAAGVIDDAQLLSLREFGSKLEGHPVPRLPGVEVATGSLGQGFPIGVGMALAGKFLDRLPFHIWVLLGDSEMAEGSIWETFDKAGYYSLGNLVGIVDVNRLGQRGETELGWDTAAYARRAEAFGWETVVIDGHDIEAIDGAFALVTLERQQPLLIVARTIKGQGVSFLADKEGFHGKPLDQDRMQAALRELGEPVRRTVCPPKPEDLTPSRQPQPAAIELPRYTIGDNQATRTVYGDALQAIGIRPDIVVLDAEVGDSTRAQKFATACPGRFFEMYIAEQQMVAAAVGLSVMGRTPFASTFGAFLTRAYDFIRMAAVSRASIRLVGSHAGVSIGQDGPSQMALEDLAMMRAVHGSTVLYPCDANQTAKLVRAMVDIKGISYMRTTRGKTPVIYAPGEDFFPGGSRVVRQSPNDQVTLIGAGVTLHEAILAADTLASEGIPVRVIDAYSVKPIDRQTLQQAARDTHGLVVVEDHWAEGGLGDAVLDAFSGNGVLPRVVKLAVREMPGSGTPAEMRDFAGISARHIVAAARQIAMSSA